MLLPPAVSKKKNTALDEYGEEEDEDMDENLEEEDMDEEWISIPIHKV